MKVAYNWLKSYIDFPYSPKELAEKLTMAGLEVEELEYLGEGLEGIVVGEIKKIKEHPDADKLVICIVDTGKDSLLQIITGASNVYEGAKVPVAGNGIKLPTGMKIKNTKLRGERSEGMICSEDELCLIDERAEGIMILEDDAEIGEEIAEYLNLNEYIIKLDLTPNYSRCLGLLGIAREIKVILNNEEKINYPEINITPLENQEINNFIDVEIEDKDLCPRYTGRLIKNVEIAPSPKWMQSRLKASGIRPINNVVDITNYVLLEYNQPLHAFDYDQIKGKKIIVRRAEKNEKLITLDGKKRALNKDILLIADEEKALGLAGVMGGENSEVIDKTVNIFLESAYFNPVNIRKTARHLGLPSEASHRFERGVDIENLINASNRAAYLLQEYAGGEIVNGIIDEYPEVYRKKDIELDIDRANKIIGIELNKDEIIEILESLEFRIKDNKDGSINVTVPSYRTDVELDADLIEEIARIYGYNRIPVTRPVSKQIGGRTLKQKIEDNVKNQFTASGLDEVLTFSLTEKKIYDKLLMNNYPDLQKWVELKNPLNESFSVLRTSLIPGIVDVLSRNAKRQVKEMRVFEIGKVFFNQGKNVRPLEKIKLAGGSMGWKEDLWNNNAADFYYLKGALEKLYDYFQMKDISFITHKLDFLHPGRTAKILYQDEEIGFIGELLPKIIEKNDMVPATSVFQLDFENLINNAIVNDYSYKNLAKYPAVSRDLAVIIDEDINVNKIYESISNNGGRILKTIELFDIYKGDPVPEGNKSLAFKLIFQSPEKTLTDEVVNKYFNKIIQGLIDKYNAKIRGK